MASKKVDPNHVVWIPPEQLDRADGEYRIAEDVETGKLGARAVAVTDGEGKTRFEEYDQTTHGQRYQARVRED